MINDTKIRGLQNALATYLCWDIAELKDAKYHHGHTGSLQLFVIGNDYMTATKTNTKKLKYPPKPKGYDDYNWVCLNEDFFGWSIWEAKI